MKSKADYEYAIRNTALFEYDKSSSAYKREELKLIENLYCYLLAVNKDKYIELGLEITETAKKCINNYKPEFGEFMHYFNKVISREFRKAFAVNRINDSHCGMHIPKNDLRIIKKYLRYTENICESRINYDALADIIGLSKDKIKQCINDFQTSGTISDVLYNDDEEISLFDINSSGYNIEKNSRIRKLRQNFLKKLKVFFHLVRKDRKKCFQ